MLDHQLTFEIQVWGNPYRKRTAPIVAARTIGALKFKVIISAPCAPKIDLIDIEGTAEITVRPMSGRVSTAGL